MSKVLKIGQISDIHIGNGEELVQGIDVCANFRSALESDSMKNLDLLVLSGDLAENAEAGAYEYVASLLKDYKAPWCIIPGNHDDLKLMQKYFDLSGKVSGDRCFYHYDLKGRSIFFLDSACGNVSKEELDWLKAETAKVKGEVILFMHHPPCFCGHRFMDLRFHLENMVEVPEGQSLNWNGPVSDDSVKYYEVEAFRNGQEYAHKHAVSKVLLWVAAGVGVVGFGVLASGFLMSDEGDGRVCRHVGEGILVGALVSAGFSFGFDMSADGYRIKAQYYNQKLADYKSRHSVLKNE